MKLFSVEALAAAVILTSAVGVASKVLLPPSDSSPKPYQAQVCPPGPPSTTEVHSVVWILNVTTPAGLSTSSCEIERSWICDDIAAKFNAFGPGWVARCEMLIKPLAPKGETT